MQILFSSSREGSKILHDPVQPLWKTVCVFLKMLKIELPYYPVIPPVSMYMKEKKSEFQRGICTPVFITALFTIAETWKHSEYSWMGKWTKKMWHTVIHCQTTETHSEKCILRWFCHCMNIIECTYPNLDGIV